MTDTYSNKTISALTKRFAQAELHRPIRLNRYELGAKLQYDIAGVEDNCTTQIKVVIKKFVGGGYAGQVYKVKVLEIDNESFTSLRVGQAYALKILIPPSGFARLFRNTLYWIGFQGPFQQQVNPTAARAGALWQKFIRRAAKIHFGDETAVNNVHATLIDKTIGSCGEISDWIDGRTWRLEVDSHMDLLRLHAKGYPVDKGQLDSKEYRAKKKFMAEFIQLLHDLGAYEFARQYEWSTCKSQPNALKRTGTDNDPKAGLVAVDFRAGLTLLPILPMSPGDFKLIWQGLKRGSLVQFDRGNLDRLKIYVDRHSEQFANMMLMLDELKLAEDTYRNSIPDITHNHIKLLYCGKLWSTILDSAVTGWRVRDIIDEPHEKKLRNSKLQTVIFCLLGLIPVLGRVLRKFWAKPNWRKHYISMLTRFDYFKRAVRGKVLEGLIAWHRKGRISSAKAQKLADKPLRFFYHLPVSILPTGLHRFLTDADFFKEKLHFLFIRPFKLYFSSELRDQWMRDMVEQGKKKHILTNEDADIILSQLNEKYIQRYLISLVVHLMTLPLTQIVSAIVAWIYWRRTGDELGAGGILILFQITPVSPGSIARGCYAVGIAIYDRSFKDYNIAVFLSFFKYIGYLAFPIQMTYHYPAMARFMASHWATEAVHIVPVFGEQGALLEHWVFCLFYNWPLTIRRRMAKRAELRAAQKPQYRHIPICAAVIAAVFVFADWVFIKQIGVLPTLLDIWYATLILPMLAGSAATLLAAGAVIWKRLIAATAAGLTAGILYTLGTWLIVSNCTADLTVPSRWPFRLFFFAVFACIGAIITELKLPDPDLEGIKKN